MGVRSPSISIVASSPGDSALISSCGSVRVRVCVRVKVKVKVRVGVGVGDRGRPGNTSRCKGRGSPYLFLVVLALFDGRHFYTLQRWGAVP